MSISCIYCENNKFNPGEGSKEHAILSALGGKKASRNVCCEDCNRRLGNEIDEPLTIGLRYISSLCGIKTDRNKDVATIGYAGTHKGRTFDLKAGGKMQFSKVDVKPPVINEENGKVILSLSARNKEEAKHLLNHQLKRFNKTIDDIEITEAVERIEYSDPVNIEIDVGLVTHHRSIAKTALTYLATLVSPDRIRSSSFNEIIEYINLGQIERDLVYLTSDGAPAINTISKTDHRVLICASNHHEKVVSFVNIFGGIGFKVLLSDRWDGPDLYKGYVVDGSSGKQIEEDIPHYLLKDTMFTDFSHLTEGGFKENISGVMANVYEKHVEIERKRIISEVVGAFCLKHGGEDFTDSLNKELSSKIAKAIANNVFRIDDKVHLDIFEDQDQ